MVILLITGDFLALFITTDNVRPSPKPNSWRIGNLTIAGAVLGICELVFCATSLAISKYHLGLATDSLRTLAAVLIVFGGQATLYAIRERGRLWFSRPGIWVVLSSVVEVAVISMLAFWGIFMAHLPSIVLAGTFAGSVGFSFLLDLIKGPLFKRLEIV